MGVPTPFPLTAQARRAFDRLASDCVRVLEARFVALVASSPTSGVVFGREIDAADLEALGALTETWHHDGLDTPLLLTPEEFHRSLDAFPLEYQAIVDHHVLIAGHAPFDNVVVDRQHLRRACEVQAKSHLIHLREGFLEGSREPRAIAALVASSAAAFRSLLADIARLDRQGGHAAADIGHTDEAVADAAHHTIGVPIDVVREVLASERSMSTAADPTALLARYIEAAEQVWRYVDRWRSA